MELLQQRDPHVPLSVACAALGLPRSTLYRQRRPKPARALRPRPSPARRLSDPERAAILEVLHSERFLDQPPAEVYATLLEEGVFLASPRTMYRVLAAAKETKERRAQRAPRSFPTPRVAASAPNQVWTWDISKLPTFTAGVFLSLYVILDLWSRYVVAWMIAERENSALAKQLFAEAISRSGIQPDKLLVHMDRGAPMTSHGFAELLSVLGVERSYSRPRVSNDNPFSESQFKTLKYQPDYPGAFEGTARRAAVGSRLLRLVQHRPPPPGPRALHAGHAVPRPSRGRGRSTTVRPRCGLLSPSRALHPRPADREATATHRLDQSRLPGRLLAHGDPAARCRTPLRSRAC